jgi:hypothetical protein
MLFLRVVVVNCVKFRELAGNGFKVFWLEAIKQANNRNHQDPVLVAYHLFLLAIFERPGFMRK